MSGKGIFSNIWASTYELKGNFIDSEVWNTGMSGDTYDKASNVNK